MQDNFLCLQVYRKEVGSICGFKMFSDSILLSLLRKVSKLQHFGAPFRSYTLNQIYRVTLNDTSRTATNVAQSL